MDYKDLLVVLQNAARAEQVGAYAHSFADAFGAHLTAAGLVELMPPAPAFFGEYPIELVQSFEEAASREIEEAYARFAKAGARPDGQEFVKITGAPQVVLDKTAALGRRFDLAIVAQPEDGDAQARDLAEAVLFRSGRPTIIVPHIQQAGAKFGKIVIAWDGGAAAARAVAESLPLLKRAGRVIVTTMVGKNVDVDSLPGVDLAHHLARHGVQAELKILPAGGDIGALLLSYVADEDADMLVMGGYGHSRLREIVLGGVTRTIFQTMTVPVFMAH